MFFGRRAVSQPTDPGIIRLTGQVADSDHHNYADQGDEQAVILKENVVDDPEKGTGRILEGLK